MVVVEVVTLETILGLGPTHWRDASNKVVENIQNAAFNPVNAKQRSFVEKIKQDHEKDKKDCSPLHYLSHVLATNTKCKVRDKKVGNVCVALASIDKTLYVSTNVNDADSGDVTTALSPRIERKCKLFFELFSLEGRAFVLGSKEGEDIWKTIHDRFTWLKMPQQTEVDKELHQKVPNRSKDSMEFDSQLEEFCNVIHHYQQLQTHSYFTETCAAIELISLMLFASTAGESATKLEIFIDAMQPKLLWHSMLMFVNIANQELIESRLIEAPGEVKSFFDAIKTAEEDICKAFQQIKADHVEVNEMFTTFEALKVYERIVHIKSQDNDKVMHCEIKLFHYLKSIGMSTNIPFYISKPLCMDCSMYFYTEIPDAERPITVATCYDHFPNVLCCTPCCVVNGLFDGVSHWGCGVQLEVVLKRTEKFSVFSLK